MRWNKGFTLVELLVLIGIFVLLAGIAVPGIYNYVRSNRLATTTERMAADMQLARSMSIANGRVYRLQANDAGYTITDPLSGEVIRNRTFHQSVDLAADVTVNFFPWGMADPRVVVIRGGAGNIQTIQILPTGVVEVN